MTLLLALGFAMQGEVPDRAKTRDAINGIIAAKRLSLGALAETVDLSIAYGAPAWNGGDHKACAAFYEDTVASILKELTGDAVGSAGRKGFEELKVASERAAAAKTADEKAWALRYGFDRVLLALRLKTLEAQELVKLGNTCFGRGQPAEAVDALGAAVEIADDLIGSDPARLDIAARIAPILLAHALFSQGKFAEAAKALQRAARMVPEGGTLKFKRRDMSPDRDAYDARLAELEAKVKESEDADLLFLLGYERFFSDKRDESKALLERSRKLEPDKAGPKWLLKALAGEAD